MNTPNDRGPAFPGKTGTELIADERKRQIEKEGYTAEYDRRHDCETLAMAAVSYALPHDLRYLVEECELWPWPARFWKPTPKARVRELVKAGALIAAEIDRLQHLAARDGKEGA